MKVQQLSYESGTGWTTRAGHLAGGTAQLVFVFGGRHLLETGQGLDGLRTRFPRARLVIASTSGEMVGTEVSEDTIAATAVSFDKTRINCVATRVGNAAGSYIAGEQLAGELIGPDLVHVFVLSDGALVNGTMAHYRVPRFKDIPPIEVVILDRKDLASAGAGETPIVCVAPAIGSAARAFGKVDTALPVKLV